MKKARLAVIVFVIIAIISTGLWWVIKSTSPPASKDILASGFIEAKNVSVAFEVSGRIVQINADEGNRVEAGAILVKLDDTFMRSQKKQNEVAIEQAQAAVSQANLSFDQSVISRDNAKKSLELAIDVQKHPLALEAAVIAAQGQVDTAQSSLALATDNFNKLTYPYSYSTVYYDVPKAQSDISDAKRIITSALANLQAPASSGNAATIPAQLQQAIDSLTKSQDLLARRGYGQDLFAGRYLSMDQYWTVRAAQLQMEQTQSVLNTAVKTLQNALDVKNDPQQINSAVQSAQAAYDMSVSAVNLANNNITLAQKQVEQTTASLKVLEAQMNKLTLVSPISGTVVSKNSEVGEIAQPGAPILSVADLSEMTLTAYIPESVIGMVKINQKSVVTVDSYPGEGFNGNVVFISPQAQFTPRDVQLKSEREKTVFAVKIKLNNPEQKLKAGMPADARIITEG